MGNKYKFDWVNNGQEFIVEKIPVSIDKKVLEYMRNQPKDLSATEKNFIEFVETIYLILLKIDKNITRELIEDKLDVTELSNLIYCFRIKNNILCECPYCCKSLSYNDIFKKEDFQDTQSKKDITMMK